MSVHSAEFEEQAVRALKETQRAVREAERARNPFRLTDAGMFWLFWLPAVTLFLGIALILGIANYETMHSIFIPESTVSDSFEFPTI